MKAYQLAIDMGADYIEQDLQLTKDGRLVCMHDSTVNRTTNETGKVSDFTLSEIKQLDAGDGERVPELEEVIMHFGDSIKYYIETKRPHDTKMDNELIRILRKHGMIGFEADRDRVIIQSFSEESLLYIYQQYSDIKFVKLTSTPDSEDLDKVRSYAVGVGPRFADTNKAFVDSAHAKGLIVHPYTVNSVANMETAISWGVDGFFTNYPDRAFSLRE